MIPRYTINGSKQVINKTTRTGFTLIELMVVVSIISMLSTAVLVNMQTLNGRARDANRLSDMNEIRNALEEFYIDYRRYPGPSDGVDITGQMIGVGLPIDDALRPYLDPIPADPSHDAGDGSGTTPVGRPSPGAIYYYFYDSSHIIDPTNCTNDYGPYRAVLGFNKAETNFALNVHKDTCTGSQLNINNADYNQALNEIGG